MIHRVVAGVVALFVMLSICLAQDRETKDAKGNRAGHAASRATMSTEKGMIGQAAAAFTAKDTKGRLVSLSRLLARPTVLVFIERGCPCCKGGKPYMDRLQNHYRDVANIVGVVYGSVAVAQSWSTENRPQFPVIADPDGTIAKSYRAEAGLATRVIDRKGVIRLSYPGYSASMLRDVALFIEQSANIKPRKMRTYPAPSEMTTGCKLGGH